MGRFSDPRSPAGGGRFTDPGGWAIRRIKPVVAWYDLWMGFYWDRKKHRLYVMVLPCLGFYVEWDYVTSSGKWGSESDII